jgi:hypothetical protein
MGWWKIGKRQEMIGDLTADEMTRGLNEIAQYYKKEGKQLPSSGSYIAAIADIIASDPTITASTDDSTADLSAFRTLAGSGTATLDGEPRKILASALRKISGIYAREEDGGRPVSLQMFANFHFVVSASPSRYMSDERQLKALQKTILGE